MYFRKIYCHGYFIACSYGINSSTKLQRFPLWDIFFNCSGYSLYYGSLSNSTVVAKMKAPLLVYHTQEIETSRETDLSHRNVFWPEKDICSNRYEC